MSCFGIKKEMKTFSFDTSHDNNKDRKYHFMKRKESNKYTILLEVVKIKCNILYKSLKLWAVENSSNIESSGGLSPKLLDVS